MMRTVGGEEEKAGLLRNILGVFLHLLGETYYSVVRIYHGMEYRCSFTEFRLPCGGSVFHFLTYFQEGSNCLPSPLAGRQSCIGCDSAKSFDHRQDKHPVVWLESFSKPTSISSAARLSVRLRGLQEPVYGTRLHQPRADLRHRGAAHPQVLCRPPGARHDSPVPNTNNNTKVRGIEVWEETGIGLLFQRDRKCGACGAPPDNFLRVLQADNVESSQHTPVPRREAGRKITLQYPPRQQGLNLLFRILYVSG